MTLKSLKKPIKFWSQKHGLPSLLDPGGIANHEPNKQGLPDLRFPLSIIGFLAVLSIFYDILQAPQKHVVVDPLFPLSFSHYIP